MRPAAVLRRRLDGALTPDEDPLLDELLGVQGSAAVRTMLHGYPQPVGLLWAVRDAAGRITDFEFGYGNPLILELFAMPENQRGRYTLLEALPQMREDGSFEVYAAICDGGEPIVDEITFDTPFGDGYARGTLLRRTAKLGDGLIVALDDVTEQRRMEAELRGYAHAVAHDLSEPISAMAAIVALLERRAGEPPDPRALELLHETTTRARQLIDGVLDYARAGELQRDAVSLRRLMAEVSADLRPRLDEAGAVLMVGDLPEVRGDAGLLRRVLQNLVANAVKFRGDEPPRIAVDGRAGARDWVVTVRDHGVGVAPEDADRIFGMFARADRERTGNGIGLAVCRRVVEAHGGRIWVEPADGGGSAFRFTLPR
jgi:signal transduction histidine kinase